MTARRKPGPVKAINLALQGGGAHGALTWGVLDQLLEDGRLTIEGISATSAGAMNAAVLAQGYMAGGREGARLALESFWRAVSAAGSASPLRPSLLDRWSGNWNMDYSATYLVFDVLTRMLAPSQLNPLGLNPLRDLLVAAIDFDRLRRCTAPKLYVSATNARSGKIKVFENHEVSADVLMASACLPFLYEAVEIDGEPYWDGGYLGNPAIFPLIYNCDSPDVLVVRVNPIRREDLPKTARGILNRINEISFNSSLMREMRAIAFVTRLIDDGTVKDGRLKRMLIHSIEADEYMAGLDYSSKLNPDWDFLTHLRDVGRERARVWLAANVDKVGVQSSIDIREAFL